MAKLTFEADERRRSLIEVLYDVAPDEPRYTCAAGAIRNPADEGWRFLPSGLCLHDDELDQIAAKLRELNAAEGGSDEQ